MEELVIKAKKGDKSAYSELISTLQNDLYRLAYARLNSHEDVNDALQQTTIYAYKNINQLREPKYFKTWIVKILINECNKIYHQNYKKTSIFDKLLNSQDLREEQIYNYNNIDDKLDIEHILNKLSYEERICIILFYRGGYSTSEIANILSTNENTIRSRISRTKSKIKALYNR